MCLWKKGNSTSAVKRTGSQIYRWQRSGVTVLDAYKECFFLSGASLTVTMSTAFQHKYTVFLLHWAYVGLVELCVWMRGVGVRKRSLYMPVCVCVVVCCYGSTLECWVLHYKGSLMNMLSVTMSTLRCSKTERQTQRDMPNAMHLRWWVAYYVFPKSIFSWTHLLSCHENKHLKHCLVPWVLANLWCEASSD